MARAAAVTSCASCGSPRRVCETLLLLDGADARTCCEGCSHVWLGSIVDAVERAVAHVSSVAAYSSALLAAVAQRGGEAAESTSTMLLTLRRAVLDGLLLSGAIVTPAPAEAAEADDDDVTERTSRGGVLACSARVVSDAFVWVCHAPAPRLDEPHAHLFRATSLDPLRSTPTLIPGGSR